MKRVVAVVATFVVLAASLQASADDALDRIRGMIADLGGHTKAQANNGRILPCTYRGSKRITVTQKGDVTTYRATYNNCRENGTIRDGIYEVVVKNGEVVADTKRRSVNGELYDAVSAGQAKKVRELLRKKADVNYSESIRLAGGGYVDEWTPLMTAAISGNLRIVKMLVKSGAWVNYMNSHVANALWLAANGGHLDVVKYLVKHGAYVNNQDKDNITPLMIATISGYTDVVKYLLASSADVNLRHKDGDSSLMFAIARGHTDIARVLLHAGADVNVRNRYGVTALMIAADKGDVVMARALLGKGADVALKTNQGKTALDIATTRGHTEIAALLKGDAGSHPKGE